MGFMMYCVTLLGARWWWCVLTFFVRPFFHFSNAKKFEGRKTDTRDKVVYPR